MVDLRNVTLIGTALRRNSLLGDDVAQQVAPTVLWYRLAEVLGESPLDHLCIIFGDALADGQAPKDRKAASLGELLEQRCKAFAEQWQGEVIGLHVSKGLAGSPEMTQGRSKAVHLCTRPVGDVTLSLIHI